MRIVIISNKPELSNEMHTFLQNKEFLTILYTNPFIALSHFDSLRPDLVILFRDNMSSISFNAFIDNYWIHDKTFSCLILIAKDKKKYPPLTEGLPMISPDDFTSLEAVINTKSLEIFSTKRKNLEYNLSWQTSTFRKTTEFLPADKIEYFLLNIYIHLQSIRIHLLGGYRRDMLYNIDTMFDIFRDYPDITLFFTITEYINDFILESSLFYLGSKPLPLLKPNRFRDFSEAANYYKKELLIFFDQLTDANKHISSKIFDVLQYLERNYMNPSSLNQLSSLFFISPSHLSKLFKKEMGLGFVAYHNKTRIEIACLLLCFTTISTESISEKVGFSDVKYFLRVFKAKTGCTPKDYRNKHYPAI